MEVKATDWKEKLKSNFYVNLLTGKPFKFSVV